MKEINTDNIIDKGGKFIMKITRKRIIYTAIVTLIVVFSSTFAILMTLERTDYRNYLQSEYSKNMFELINSVQNIRVNLAKSGVVGSREQSIVVFEEIFRNASMANDKLNSLPIPQEVSANSSKFLSQIGDFCYTLGTAASEGKQLTEQDYASIERLKKQSFALEEQLNNISSNINRGNIKWGEIRKKVTGVLAKQDGQLVSDKFTGIQKQIAQYPSLIYDGPFSDNNLDINPRINEQNLISLEDGKKAAVNIIGKNKVSSVDYKADESNTKIGSYRFDVKIKGRDNKKGSIICEISKRGGKVIYLLDSRSVGQPKIDTSKATDVGTKYLNSIGYKNMNPIYILNYGNIAVISFVYKQDNIIMYPDQIKLKVALDNGDIVGIESEKYLISHIDNRKLSSPKITEEQARTKVGKRLKINSVKLVVIPTETNKEVLCYEYSGIYNNDNFKVYINAETGYEQRIVQIINTPNGQLTM
ncbi:MAG: spore gernimation protein [Clostridiaceae bacterium]|jgi:germination protein YpeB|nr:spore gernimation protein [Clostridiaceae bacterium]